MLEEIKKEMSKRFNPFDESREKEILRKEIKKNLKQVIDEYKDDDESGR